MFKRPIVLLDCDGVLADFTSAVLKFVKDTTGRTYTHDDVTDWDVLESIGHKDLEPTLDTAINIDGFCLDIPVYDGVIDMLSELRTFSTVVCVTAPHHADLWPGHRARWLQEKLGFDKYHVIHTHAKFLVDGDVFVDDSGRNVSTWAKWHPNSYSLLFDQLYNRHHQDDAIIRICKYDEIIDYTKRKI